MAGLIIIVPIFAVYVPDILSLFHYESKMHVAYFIIIDYYDSSLIHIICIIFALYLHYICSASQTAYGELFISTNHIYCFSLMFYI